MSDDATAIAKRLTQAQRKALLWLPPETDTARSCPRKMSASLRAMAPLASGPAGGLVWPVGSYGNWYRVTPEGAAVRAIVAQEPRDD